MGQPPLASRMAQIAPFHVMALLGRARELEAEGRSIIHMEIGEPDFPTPPAVVAAAREALASGQTHYTPALGLPALREAIAEHYQRRYGVDVPARRIVITSGASGALLLALGVVLDRDSEVLMADPGYPCNRHFVRFIEGKVRTIPTGPQEGFQINAALLEQHWREPTRAVMVASPSNPTGTVIPAAEMAAMASLVERRGGVMVVDEIYHELTYAQDSPSALSVSERLFVTNSFSKYFCMTGWRLGWLVVPEPYLEMVERLAQNLFIAPPTLSQHAALAAFLPETIALLEQQKQILAERRDYLVGALRELGFVIPCEPDGAFYLYADCSAFSEDSMQLAQQLLEEAGVAVTPGIDFGDNQGQHYLRFSFTTELSQLREGVARIGNWLQRPA